MARGLVVWLPWLAVLVVVIWVSPEAHFHDPYRLGTGILAGMLFGIVAWRLKFLNRSGSIVGGLFGFSLVTLGDGSWILPALAFFVLSSLLSQVGRSRKVAAQAITEKTDVRDAGQVLANGGVAWVLLLIHALFPDGLWYWGFLGALSAAAADTWATEVGTLSSEKPRLITTGRSVLPGTSGAVSLMGLAGAFGGALSIWGVVCLVAPSAYNAMPWAFSFVTVVVVGVLASLVDSLAGATLQARFRDHVTGQETERPFSTQGANILLHGIAGFQNNQVNGLCTFTGGILALACFHLLKFAF